MKIRIQLLILLFITNAGWLQIWAQDYKPTPYDVICQIQVTVVNDLKVNWDKFKNLKDLGRFTTQSVEIDPAPLEGKSRVILGSYLGKITAQKVLAEVKKRGYNKAKIIDDGGFSLGHSTGKSLRYSVQLGAFKSMKMINMSQYPTQDEDDQIYLQYKNRAYKVLYGLFGGQPSPGDAKENLIPWLKKKGYKTFVQQFR